MFVCFLLVFDYLFIVFKVASWTSTRKELTSWLSNCIVISLCRLDLFVFLSGKGRGIRLYWFLIIVFSSTMNNRIKSEVCFCIFSFIVNFLSVMIHYCFFLLM